VVPTGRLYLLLLASALPLALDDALPGLWLATPLGLGVLALAVLLEWRMGPGGRAFTARRISPDRLSIGVENPIEVVVHNAGGRSTAILVRDELPPALPSDRLVLVGRVAAGAEARLQYTVTPPRRGDFQFDRIVLRWRGALGLAWRQRAFPAEQGIKVYPNLRDLHRYDLLVRRGLLSDAGSRLARRFGPGTEFERLREYVPDDEYRRINWKATARRGVPIVNEFETERSQNVLIALDSGRLMAAVADGLTKLDHALNAGLLLTYAASLRGDRVALLCYADRVSAFLPPRRGRRAFLQILERLYRLQAEPTESDHAAAFSYLAARNPRRSLLVLFTDLSEPESARALVAHLARASSRHLVAVCTVSDPALTVPGRVRGARRAAGLREAGGPAPAGGAPAGAARAGEPGRHHTGPTGRPAVGPDRGDLSRAQGARPALAGCCLVARHMKP
jgi:uncharacterized protein (DUF58 family)